MSGSVDALRSAANAVRRADADPDWFGWAEGVLRTEWQRARTWPASGPAAYDRVDALQRAAELAAAILVSPACPESTARSVLSAGPMEVPVMGVEEAARSAGLPDWMWDELASHRHARVRQAVLRNPDAPERARSVAALAG